MSFLLDTCTLSELTRPAPNPGVRRWIERQEQTALFVSVLTLGEIGKGIALLPDGGKKRALTTWLATIRSTHIDRFLPVDAAVAALWGRLAARASGGGRTLSVIDGLIAATAIHHGYTLVARNTSDFESTEVGLLNPWEEDEPPRT